MDVAGSTLIGLVAAVLLMLAASIGIFVGAVWFGMRIVAPRLRRVVDRVEGDEDERD